MTLAQGGDELTGALLPCCCRAADEEQIHQAGWTSNSEIHLGLKTGLLGRQGASTGSFIWVCRLRGVSLLTIEAV